MFRVKIKAAFIHGLATAFVAFVAWILVFKVWYADGLAGVAEGANLYLLVLVVEIVLGPTMSFVLYNPDKPRKELVMDYSLVLAVQAAALFYGLYTVALSRPVYLVFVKDRVELVSAVELSDSDLRDAPTGYDELSWLGVKLVCVNFPTDPQEKSDLLFSSVAGKDVQLMPKYYRACNDGEVTNDAFSAKQFYQLHPESGGTMTTLEGSNFTWLPIVTRFGAWTAIYPNNDLNSVIYLDKYPFEN